MNTDTNIQPSYWASMQAEILQLREALEKVKRGLCYPDEYRQVADEALSRERSASLAAQENRFVECFNVLQGINDPASFVETAKKLIHALYSNGQGNECYPPNQHDGRELSLQWGLLINALAKIEYHNNGGHI